MAEITDIEKLRPELMNKSLAELERQATELEMAILRKKEQAEAKRLESIKAEANQRKEQIVENMKWLESNGLLSDKVRNYFTVNRAGKETFAPHLSFMTRS